MNSARSTSHVVMRLSRIMLPVLLLALAACGERETGSGADVRLTVFAPVEPVAHIVSAIAGDRAAVHTLLRPGQDPHSTALSPSVAEGLARADLFIGAGLPMEESIVSRMGKDADWYLNIAGDHDDQDHAHGEHEHSDPHAWLSPRLLVLAADRVRENLSMIDPEGDAEYQENFRSFSSTVGQAVEEARAVLEPYSGAPFYVQHGAFEHFAEFFGLEQVALEMHGREPTPRDIAQLAERARREGVKVVFTQPQQNPAPIRMLADAIGAEVRTLDPLAEDPVENIRQLARQLALAFELQMAGAQQQ